jgi:hypothetical protein
LETIKHLFLVKNIVFVLAINKEQLSNSIKGVYGNDFNSKLYLEKFLHLTVALNCKPVDNNRSVELPKEFVGNTARRLEIELPIDKITLLANIQKFLQIPARQMIKVIVLIGILKSVNPKYLNDELIGISSLICAWHVYSPTVNDELEAILTTANISFDINWLYKTLDTPTLGLKYIKEIQYLLSGTIASKENQSTKKILLEAFPDYRGDPSRIIREILTTVRCLT